MVKRRLIYDHPLPGWKTKEEHLSFKGSISVTEPIRIKLILSHHDNRMVGHFGHRKTTNLIHQSCHWLGLTQMVKQYINPVWYVHVPRQTGVDGEVRSTIQH